MSHFNFQKKAAALGILAAISLTACGSSTASIEDVRTKFIDAGGACTSETPSTTTTVEDDEPWFLTSIDSINCGKDEPNITLYNSANDALKALHFSESLKSGIMRSLAYDTFETQTLVLNNALIYLPSDEYTRSKAEGIADKMGAALQLGPDKETFDNLIKITENGGLNMTAEGCFSQKLLASDGASISFDTKGEEDTQGDSMASAYCVLHALLAPEYIFENISKTRALDGLLEESWGEFRVNWRYHPDNGVQMTIIHRT